MPKKILPLLAAIVFLMNACSSSDAGSPTTSSSYKLPVNELSLSNLTVSGYADLADYQKGDAAYKYSGFYSWDSNAVSNNRYPERIYLSCAEGQYTRFRIRFPDNYDTIVNDFKLNSGADYFKIGNAEFHLSKSDSTIAFLCDGANSDVIGDVYLIGNYAGHTNYDTLVEFHVRVDSIVHLADTIYDLTAANDLCSSNFSSAMDLLAPYRQAQVEGTTACIEGKHSLMPINYDYSSSPSIVYCPWTRSTISGIQANIYDSVVVSIKAGFKKSSIPWTAEHDSIYRSLKATEDSENAIMASAWDDYHSDTGRVTLLCEAYSGYDTAYYSYYDAGDSLVKEDTVSGFRADSESHVLAVTNPVFLLCGHAA